MELARFEQLEAKIQELISLHAANRKKNEELLEIIAQKDQDMERLKRELETVLEERKRISERVDALIGRIDELDVL